MFNLLTLNQRLIEGPKKINKQFDLKNSSWLDVYLVEFELRLWSRRNMTKIPYSSYQKYLVSQQSLPNYFLSSVIYQTVMHYVNPQA